MSYWYLATPYSKYPDGIYAAHRLACREAGRFVRHGIPVFSPISHSHSIAVASCIDPVDHTIWIPADRPLMAAAFGLVVCCAESWRESKGIELEISEFEFAQKPVKYYEPDACTDEFIESLRRNLARRQVA